MKISKNGVTAQYVTAIIAAVTAIAATVATAVSNADIDAAAEVSKELADQQRADLLKKRKKDTRFGKAQLQLNKDRLDRSEGLINFAEEKREEDRLDIRRKQKVAGVDNLTNVLTPNPDDLKAKQNRIRRGI